MITRIGSAAGLLVCSIGLLYWNVIARLVSVWAHNEDYSHGFLVAPVCAYFLWERRRELVSAEVRPATLPGAAVVAFGLVLLAAGSLCAEAFLQRLSLVVVLTGTALFTLGRRHVRLAALPIAFSLLMIPLPAIVFNQITFPLQLLASRAAETGLTAFGIPVLREGNVIVLANTTLEVAEACSGIRSLLSLVALAVVYGHFVERRRPVRLLLAASAVPIAVVANAVRVAGTGLAAHFIGPAAAEGFLHAFSGWLVFVAATILLVATERLLSWVSPVGSPRTVQVPVEAA